MRVVFGQGIEESRTPPARSTSARGPRDSSAVPFEAVKPPRRPPARFEATPRLAACDSLSFERATLSRDGARIRRMLAACRTRPAMSLGHDASSDPRASAAVRPVVFSRGAAAWGAGAAGNSSVVVRKARSASRDMRGTHRVPRTMRTGGSAAREQMTREHRSLEPRRSRHAASRPFSPPGSAS